MFVEQNKNAKFNIMQNGTVLTREMIENIKVGDILPNYFGKMKPITEIHHRGNDANGKLYVYFYQKFLEDSTMSNTLKEGQKITLP